MNMPKIEIKRFSDAHLEGVTSLYNEPAVCRQMLQMPYQSIDTWRKRLTADSERHLQLVALHNNEVIGNIGLEQYSRVRRSHAGGLGMAVATIWQGKGIGSRLLEVALDVADNWMNLHRIELTVYTDNEMAINLYHKFSFETEGQLHEYAVRDGNFIDALSMARIRKP